MTATVEIMDCPMRTGEQLARDLAGIVSPATVVRADEPLARRTTLRVGGPADAYVEPASEADLAAILNFCATREEKFFVLGRGSNLIVRDGGFRGVVICLAQPHFSRIEIVNDRLRCGAGAKLKTVSVEAKRHGLSGVEFLEGIPGSVGGALRMNAGAMGSATFDAVETMRCMDFTGRVFEVRSQKSEVSGQTSVLCPLTSVLWPVEYRACPLLRNHLALEAVFRCAPAPRSEIDQRMNVFSQKRWNSQPAAPSAGCMFKNPPAIPAGKVVDELGLKGTRVGGAVVSAEHGNFIVNDNHATARDVLELIETVRQRVRAVRGVELHTEVEIIGED